jgi:D-amino-acid dehydrogenase
MHVAVVGGGIVGVSTAYFLRREGYAVTLLERNSGVAQEASFADGGVIVSACDAPWAAPGMRRKLLASLFAKDGPQLLRPALDPALYAWMVRWFGQCTLERYRINKSRMQRVAIYSRDALHAVRDELKLNYEQSQGYLQIFRTQADMDASQPARDMLTEAGVPHQLLDAETARRLEPSLNPDVAMAGALHLPESEAGNCALFARQLRKQAESDGVNFQFNCRVTGIYSSGGRWALASENRAPLVIDAIVIAAGVESAQLLKPLGVRVPLYPVKGHSATVPLKEAFPAPKMALMDAANQVAITRLGNRLRIAGTAELGSRALQMRGSAQSALMRVVSEWLPGVARYQEATFWCGARPMLPDGAPLLGGTRQPGLFLNIGHGASGWAMACGSARVLADCVAGRKAEIDLDGLTLARYKQ